MSVSKEPLTKQAIRVYATLKGLKRNGEDDAVDALVPFLLPILETMRGKIFANRLLQIGVAALYGWKITTEVAESFKSRLINRGYLELKKDNKNDIYICTPPNELELSETEVGFATALSLVIDEFEKYPERTSSLFHVSKNRDSLEDILVRFLVSLDLYTDDSLAQQLRALKGKTNEESYFQSLTDGGHLLSTEDRYLCARFIKSLSDVNSPLLASLSNIAAVGLLADVVNDFVKPTGIVKRSDLTVVLDAPFAMRIIGTSGTAEKIEAQSIIAALKSIGCTIVLFSTSCNEIARNLRMMLKEERSDRWGPTHTAMVRGEVNVDFVEAVMRDPETASKEAGIHVRRINLTDYENSHRYFSREMYEDFLGGVHRNSMDAREHDAECVALVMRQRNGVHRNDPMDCKYVFVTGNGSLAAYSRDYCIRNKFLEERACGPVITTQDLATMAWLRTGFGEAESLPKKHMLAACEKVLRAQKTVVEKVRSELSRANPERIAELQLLLLDHRSVTRMMDTTLGSAENVKQENVEALLNDMVRSTAEIVETEYKEKLKKEKGLSKTLNAKVVQAETENGLIRDQLKAVEMREREQIVKLVHSANKMVRCLYWIIVSTFGVLAMIGLFDILRMDHLFEKLLYGELISKFATAFFFLIAAYLAAADLFNWRKFAFEALLNALAKWLFKNSIVKARLQESRFVSEVVPKAGQLDFIAPF